MSSPDGWTEGEGDLPFLPQQDGFDGVRRFFDDLLWPHTVSPDGVETWTNPRPAEPTYHVICCVCRGEGWIRAVTEYVNPNLGTRTTGTLTTSCLACDGSGSVGMVRERKGTR